MEQDFDIVHIEGELDFINNHPIASMLYIGSTVLVSIVGIIGSLGICGIKLRKLKELKATDILIVNFSVGILLRSVLIVLVLINDYNGTSHVWICYLRHIMIHLCTEIEMNSIFALIIVSINFSKMSARNGAKILIIIWIIGVLCGYPYKNYKIIKVFSLSGRDVDYCSPVDCDEFRSLELRLVIIGYIVPLIGFVVASLIINYMKRLMNFSLEENISMYALSLTTFCYLFLIIEMIHILLHYLILKLGIREIVLIGSVQTFVIILNPIALYLYDAKFNKAIVSIFKECSSKKDAAHLEEDGNILVC